MNAILVLTMAWSLGQVPVQTAAPPPCAACSSSGGASGSTGGFASRTCGGACNGCVDPYGCDGFGCKLRSHMRTLFRRDDSAPHGSCYLLFHRSRNLIAQDRVDLHFMFDTDAKIIPASANLFTSSY